MRLRGHGSFPNGFARNTNRPEARAEQIVGRERSQLVSQRQLARNVVVARRVNSDVRHLSHHGNSQIEPPTDFPLEMVAVVAGDLFIVDGLVPVARARESSLLTRLCDRWSSLWKFRDDWSLEEPDTVMAALVFDGSCGSTIVCS